MRRLSRAVAALTLTASLCGCSQIAAIAPVGGNRTAEVRFAGIDVLTAHKVDIRTAPVCVQSDAGAITCEGDTITGERIRFSSSDASPDDLTVTVGSDTLYSGSLQQVLEHAMVTP